MSKEMFEAVGVREYDAFTYIVYCQTVETYYKESKCKKCGEKSKKKKPKYIYNTHISGVFSNEDTAKKYLESRKEINRENFSIKYFLETEEFVIGDVLNKNKQYKAYLEKDGKIVEIIELPIEEVCLGTELGENWSKRHQKSLIQMRFFARDKEHAVAMCEQQYNEYEEDRIATKKMLQEDREEYDRLFQIYVDDPTEENYNNVPY